MKFNIQKKKINQTLKIDPYKILNMSKNYDKNSLKKSYLKLAVKISSR